MFGGTRSLGCADATGGGIVLAFATALSLVEDLSHPGALPLRSITADLIGVVFGLTAFCFSSWLSLRRWRWLALGAYIVLVLIYSLSSIETHNLVPFCATLVLIEVGAGALTPWETSWQVG